MKSRNKIAGRTRSRWTTLAGSMGMEPAFHLIYLVFLFLPWLFATPRSIDIVVAVVSVLIFIPLHFYAFRASTRQRLLPIALVAVIGGVTNFFMVGAGVFHIYCAAMAGFCRPVRLSGSVLALCVLVYVAFAYVADRTLIEMGFILFMAFIIWFSTMSTAQTLLDNQQLEREHELDTQAASVLERERIGRDLHDLLGHTLTMVALKSDLANRLIDSDPEKAKIEIQEIQEGARRALNDVRVALSGLAAVSVATELDNACKALKSAGVELTVTGAIPDFSVEQNQACGLMIREAATNIIRHTSATTAHIEFHSGSDTQRLTVCDNGGGKVGEEGRGLNGLRNRIESLGGSVLIDDVSGVSLSATLPTASA